MYTSRPKISGTPVPLAVAALLIVTDVGDVAGLRLLIVVNGGMAVRRDAGCTEPETATGMPERMDAAEYCAEAVILLMVVELAVRSPRARTQRIGRCKRGRSG